MRAGRRAAHAAGAVLLALAATAVLSSASAASCAAAYAAQLRDVATQLDAGLPAQGAIHQLQAIAAGAGASAALAPVIAELESGATGAVAAQLRTYASAVQPPSGSGCGSALSDSARRALAGVYRSPALANLDRPPSTSWVQQLANAISSFLSRLLTTLGPVPTGIIAALVLGGAAVLLGWRLRQVSAERSRIRAAAGMTPLSSDPDGEWARALAAAEARDFREAVRRAYRSALLSLTGHSRLAVRSEWTTTELLAHARADPELLDRLAPAAAVFDLAWYSPLPVGEAEWEAARARCQAIRSLPRAPAARP